MILEENDSFRCYMQEREAIFGCINNDINEMNDKG